MTTRPAIDDLGAGGVRLDGLPRSVKPITRPSLSTVFSVVALTSIQLSLASPMQLVLEHLVGEFDDRLRRGGKRDDFSLNVFATRRLNFHILARGFRKQNRIIDRRPERITQRLRTLRRECQAVPRRRARHTAVV